MKAARTIMQTVHDWTSGCRRWLGGTAGSFGELLLPRRCTHCDAEMDAAEGPLLCRACRKALLAEQQNRCPRCADLLPAALLSPCRTCRKRKPPFERTWALGGYAGELRSAVLKMKRPAAEPLAAAMAELLCCTLGEPIREWRPDAVLPVPMHWGRRLLRGANSAETFSSVLAKELQLAHAGECLVRRRHTRPQSELAPSERFRNVRGAFQVRRGVQFSGARLLVVDDILTTGATCGEIARLLLHSGASAVAVAVAARASDAP